MDARIDGAASIDARPTVGRVHVMWTTEPSGVWATDIAPGGAPGSAVLLGGGWGGELAVEPDGLGVALFEPGPGGLDTAVWTAGAAAWTGTAHLSEPLSGTTHLQDVSIGGGVAAAVWSHHVFGTGSLTHLAIYE